MAEKFTGSFTQQEPIPEDAIEAAVEVMRQGRLHRYNVMPDEIGPVAELEQMFAAYVGAKYALAVASGGYAMGCALRALDVSPGDEVLTNAFTLAPVPGAIASVGAVPVFVEVTENLVIDIDDLESRAKTSKAKVLLLSHMRGHLCDMDRLMEVANTCGLLVVEDCAHTMGASWRGVASGQHGVIACYSTQTYKHINSGEGGFLTTNDPEIMARAILLSGSYMLYERHRAAPPAEVFEKVKYDTPNVSGRMDNLRAAIMIPQLKSLDTQVEAWSRLYSEMESGLKNAAGVTLVERHPDGRFVGSSIQFRMPDCAAAELDDFATRCAARGVDLKWFGSAEPRAFTSRYDSWRYARPGRLPQTDGIMAGLMDMRLPLTFTKEDCRVISRIICQEVERLLAATTNG